MLDLRRPRRPPPRPPRLELGFGAVAVRGKHPPRRGRDVLRLLGARRFDPHRRRRRRGLRLVLPVAPPVCRHQARRRRRRAQSPRPAHDHAHRGRARRTPRLVARAAAGFVRGRGRVATLQAGPAGERDFAAARVVLRRAAGDRLGHLRPRLPRAHRGERAGEVGQSRSPQAQGLAVVLAAVRRRGVGRRGGRRLGRGVFVGPRVVERGGVVRGVGGVAVVRRRLRGVRERPRLWVGL
mmetsp:Transcript_33564/g.115463  ORF Transcript_33564/g.115463 Transcript_33564/m.115463 type:complete len:238 (-) Transcript_33564:62-775(-)